MRASLVGRTKGAQLKLPARQSEAEHDRNSDARHNYIRLQWDLSLQTRVKERRLWPRLPLAIPVFVRGRDKARREMLEFSTIVNISGGGAYFATRKQPHLRVVLEIPIASPGVGELARAKRIFQARILRVAHFQGWHWCAAEFSSSTRLSKAL